MKWTMLFTDLDGTFIDFETYSSSVAAPAAQALLAAGMPVVFCSSKTYSEQIALMAEAGLSCPGIVENGSGFFIPRDFDFLAPAPAGVSPKGDWVQSLGAEKSAIDQAIEETQRALSLDLKPYADYTPTELAALTGLGRDAAVRAQDRKFSETLTAELSPAQWAEVNAHLGQSGLQAICGGRFYTVTSVACDKGKALRHLVGLRAEAMGQSVTSIAIGDSANDIPMLRAADHAFLVQRPDGEWNPIDLPGLIKVPAPGPEGWVIVAEEYLAGKI